MENKSFYYLSNWDDAAVYTRVLHTMGIPHAIESPGGPLPLEEANWPLFSPTCPYASTTTFENCSTVTAFPTEPNDDLRISCSAPACVKRTAG